MNRLLLPIRSMLSEVRIYSQREAVCIFDVSEWAHMAFALAGVFFAHIIYTMSLELLYIYFFEKFLFATAKSTSHTVFSPGNHYVYRCIRQSHCTQNEIRKKRTYNANSLRRTCQNTSIFSPCRFTLDIIFKKN